MIEFIKRFIACILVGDCIQEAYYTAKEGKVK